VRHAGASRHDGRKGFVAASRLVRVALDDGLISVTMPASARFVSYTHKNPPRHMPVNRALSILLLLATVPAGAEPLGWIDGVQEAGSNNAELRAAQLNVEATQHRERAAYSGFFPQVSAGASHTEVSGNAVTASPTEYSASVTATQNLFAGFQDSARVDQAGGNRELAETTLAATRARVSQEFKTAYAGLRYAQNNVQLTENIVHRLEENLRLVELRFEGGRENRGAFLLTRASLAQARYESLQARQALLTARTQLARALGRQDAEALEARDDVPVSEPGGEPDFAGLVQQTPELRSAQAQEKVAAAELRLARAGFYPSVNLIGNLAREGNSWFPDPERRTVTASVSVPLFSGGRDYYTSRGASASLDAAGSSTANIERQARVRLRQTWNVYVESVEKLKVDEAFVEAATTRAEIARSKYNNGLMSFEDWDRIENDLILRQKTRLVSQRERVAAEAAWEQAQGKGVWR
jgi:outer membrane protein TolC